MKFMKIVIVQSVLPAYAVSFFNHIVKSAPKIELILVADIKSSSSLNQYCQQSADFKVIHVACKFVKGLEFRPGLIEALSKIQPDIVVFSGNVRDISQLCAMLLYRFNHRQFVVWGMFHRIGGIRFASKVYYRLSAFLASKVLTYSRIGAQTLRNIGVPKHKIFIIGTAIDETVPVSYRRELSKEDVNLFKAAQSISNKKIILQVVRLSRIKQPELLIEAAVFICETYPSVIFVLIGDGEMREELEQMVIRKGLENNVRFLGAIYDEEVLARWYLSATAFVVPTCIGLSAHHAMSYGIPVVTDNSLDNQASEFDILSDGLNAMIYEESNVKSLVSSLTRLLDSPDLVKVMSVNAIYTVENVHTLDKKVQNFLRALDLA